jgi:hypothetical protein
LETRSSPRLNPPSFNPHLLPTHRLPLASLRPRGCVSHSSTSVFFFILVTSIWESSEGIPGASSNKLRVENYLNQFVN